MRVKTMVALLAVAASASFATPALAGGPTVKLGQTAAGRLLETSSGLTLYMFTRDGRNRDTCVTISGCPQVWPPFTIKGKPTAGPSVKSSLLGSITIAGGRHQVTYAGHPLYLYAGDSTVGDTGYPGFSSFGGTWFGVSATGRTVR
jgi:predicted lipoprotein with Yx(FWY)xxD motif